MSERGQEVTVAIIGLAPGGDAVGRQVGGEHPGRVVFVPFAAPGERVRARLVREKAKVAWGALLSVEVASPARVQPPCPLFGTCGGCQWQHVSRPVQLEAKRHMVARALGVAVEEVRAVGPEFGYRERARLVVGRRRRGRGRGRDGGRDRRVERGGNGGQGGGGGEPAPPVGFRALRSHDVVDVPRCPLVTPALAGAWPLARAAAQACAPGTEVSVQAGGDRVVARLGGGGHRVYRVAAGQAREEPMPAGKEPLVDVAEAGSPPLRVAAGAFAQVGRAANEALVAAVLEQVGSDPGKVLELYAGSGNFTRHLVQRSPQVLATDGDRRAVARGREQVPQARWLEQPALADAKGVDTVVLDPPREGLDEPNLPLVLAARRRVIYVSCDPQTLGRDVRRLAGEGLHLERVVALDLMPQTFHVEVVASFTRHP